MASRQIHPISTPGGQDRPYVLPCYVLVHSTGQVEYGGGRPRLIGKLGGDVLVDLRQRLGPNGTFYSQTARHPGLCVQADETVD